MATIVREAVYLGKKKVISVVTTSSEIGRGLSELEGEFNIESVSLAGTNDSQGVLNWVDITLRNDLSDKAMSAIKRVIQDYNDTFVSKYNDGDEFANEPSTLSKSIQSKTEASAKAVNRSSKKSLSKTLDDENIEDGESQSKDSSL